MAGDAHHPTRDRAGPAPGQQRRMEYTARHEMGWERRHGGRWYLYLNRRVNGLPVKEYLAAEDRFGTGFGEMMADDLAQLQKRERKVRALRTKVRATYRERIDGLLAATAAA